MRQATTMLMVGMLLLALAAGVALAAEVACMSGACTGHQESRLDHRHDTVRGGKGDDEIFADNGAADSINCGAGTDQVVFDAMLDTVTDNCEIQNPQ